MIVLDTNVLSEIMKDSPASQVLTWVNRQVMEDIWVTAITAAEVLSGASMLPEGRRQRALHQTIVTWLEETLDARVLAFNLDAAYTYASILGIRKRLGRPISGPDAQIAAIALAHGATLATRNVKDFAETGVALVNPWEADTQ